MLKTREENNGLKAKVSRLEAMQRTLASQEAEFQAQRDELNRLKLSIGESGFSSVQSIQAVIGEARSKADQLEVANRQLEGQLAEASAQSAAHAKQHRNLETLLEVSVLDVIRCG